jgi:aminoglycoside 2''-phosphotransferase
MSTDPSGITALIERATGLTVRTSALIDTGAEHQILEVNDEWIFRLPRQRPPRPNERTRWDFLAAFAKRSPVAVPDPVYVTDDFIGYRKLAGAPLHPAQVECLNREAKARIAEQLGVFLAALHRCDDPRIDFDAGYLVMRHGYDRSCPEAFAKYLRASERRRLDAKLEAIANNPANFVEPTAIIHGDLYFSNMLWDPRDGVMTGILDWSDMGRGIPAMDFIALADFTGSRNDGFLRDILRWYGAGDGLFEQVKENAIIEVLNWLWFYEARQDREGIARTVERLRRSLNA